MPRCSATVLAAAMALSCGTAASSDYARDPCPAPEALRKEGGAIFATRDTLAAAARRLDDQGRKHDAQCDRDFPVGSASEVACGASKVKLAQAIATHDGHVDRYQGDLRALIDQALARIDRRMVETRSRLAGVAPSAQAWNREMDAWIELGEDARREAQWTGYEKLAGLSLEGIKAGIGAQLSVSEAIRSNFKAWLAASGQALPVGALAPLEQQIRELRSGRDVINMLNFLYEQHTRAYSVAKPLQAGKNWEASAQALAGALKLSLSLMQNASLQAKLAVDITELAIDASYGWLARGAAIQRVEQFAALQEGQLDAVKALTRLYTTDVDARKALRQARRHLDSTACR